MEKLRQLPIYWQLVMLLLVATLLAYGFHSFFVSDVYTEADKVQKQADVLQRKNEQARIATQHIEEFRQLYAAKVVEYDELKVLLPEEREITNILQGVQDTARSSSLTMVRFTPRDDAPLGSATLPPAPAPGAPANVAVVVKQEKTPIVIPNVDVPPNFITVKPVEIEVSSNFTNLRQFYEKMAQLTRIVSITDFKISQRPTQGAGKTIDASFLLSAFYATPESAKTPIVKPVAPGTPGAAIPPAK
ncbi:MAG: type 4a pilus biogenesis protein PilO [Pyrinomonadaceae bacterium]